MHVAQKIAPPNPSWFSNPYADAVFRLAWKWSLLSFPSIPPFASLSFCSQPDFLLYLLNLGTSLIRAKENSFTLNHHPPRTTALAMSMHGVHSEHQFVSFASEDASHIYTMVWRLQLHRISVIAPTKLHLLSTQSNSKVGICHKLMAYPKSFGFCLGGDYTIVKTQGQ